MNKILTVTLIDEDLLGLLEKLPANEVLAMIESATEQVRSAVSFVRSGEAIPEEVAAMPFFLADTTILSTVEDWQDMDPRTEIRHSNARYVLHSLGPMPDPQA